MTAPEPTRPADEHTDAVALDLDAIHETICDNFTGMAEVRQAADLLVAEVRSLRANWRMVTTALGYGDGITEPQIEHRDFVAECERQFAEASEWRESQRWRDECHEAGHPDDEDCYEHDPVLALVALRAKVAAVEAHPVVIELAEERTRQTAKHGDQSHLSDGTGPALWLSMDDDYVRRHGIRRDNLAAWAKARTDEASQASGDGSITFEHILTEEWAEAIAESDPVALRAELVQVAAVAVQWVEAIDLRAALATTGEGQ